jgi:inorganic pyrophosphatase
MYTLRQTGQPNTLDYRVYYEKEGTPISAWHDIPLYANEEKSVLNMVIEIPRWTNAKFEISRDEFLNPIKQDTKKGKLRFVRNRFPYKGYIWNYGALPRTWEDPSNTFSETNTHGDNDPLDACEIGEQAAYSGQIKQVKVLGVMLLLDEGETDWKIIVIDVKDPLAEKLNDIDDVETHMPGLLNATVEWFRFYKVPDGKPVNQVAFEGQFKNKSFALKIIDECSEAWDKLINIKTPPEEISLANISNSGSPHRVDTDQPKVPKADDLQPRPIPQEVDKWFFIPATPL